MHSEKITRNVFYAVFKKKKRIIKYNICIEINIQTFMIFIITNDKSFKMC